MQRGSPKGIDVVDACQKVWAIVEFAQKQAYEEGKKQALSDLKTEFQQALEGLRTEIENELAVFVDDKSFMAGHDSAKKKVLKAIDSKIPFFQEEQAKNGLLTPKKMDGD